MATVHLYAESKYGFSGQYIAKLTGRAERVQFSREFCGSKCGKRGESTSYDTDEVGLYEVCDVNKHGKSKTYYVVIPWRDDLRKLTSDHEDALAIAKRLDGGERLEDFVVAELGDEITKYEYYSACATCDRELATGESCPDHPEAARKPVGRQVPDLKEDGTPKHKLVYAIRTKTETKAAAAAATVDSAVDAIVAALASLPEPLQRKALAAVKARLAPPKANGTSEIEAS